MYDFNIGLSLNYIKDLRLKDPLMFFNLAHQRFEGCIKNFKPCQSCWSQGPSKTWSEINGQKIRFGKYADDFYFSSNVTHALTICPQMQVKVALLYNILSREMENV